MTTRGAVACGNQATAEAAVAVLRAGGNAVDATLAAGFTAAVSEPGLTSLGGGGFLLVRLPGGGEHLLDFFVDAPGRGSQPAALEPHFTPVTVMFSGAEQIFHAGFGSVAVPGVLDGYLDAHRRFGRLPLDQILMPARQAAMRGVPVAKTQAEVLGLLRDILTLTPEAAAVFAPTGDVPQAGDLLLNPLYADFLDELATTQCRGWHDAPGVADLVQSMSEQHGLLSAADLHEYQVMERDPLITSYRGVTITTNPAPSFGGTIICDSLKQLESAGPVVSASEAAVRVVEAIAAATGRAKRPDEPRSSKGTTHISVVDGDGGLATMTTSNGSCSGVMAPGTGVQLNNVMGEADLHPAGFHATSPGTRIGSMMSPMLLDLPDGRVVALGSGGSERIRSALVQAVVGIVDGDQTLAEVIAAPRVHPDGPTVQVEPGLSSHTRAALAVHGPVNTWTDRNVYFGGVHAVSWHPDGVVAAAGDPRRDGVGLIVDL